MTAIVQSAGLRMARSIETIALAEAGPSEKNRTLTAPLVDALWDSGLMQFMNPRVAGGHEPGFAELIETWIEMARQDGSLGWIGIANIPSSCFAATYATEASREIVQWAHLSAGTSAIREGSRLERAFRDMYTGTQHAFISENTYTEAGKMMLGLIQDSTAL